MKRLEEWLEARIGHTVNAISRSKEGIYSVWVSDEIGDEWHGAGPTLEAAINAALDAAEGVKRG